MGVYKIDMHTSACLYLPCGSQKGAGGGGGETLAKCLCWGNVVRSFQPIYQEKCAIDHTPLFNQIQFQTFWKELWQVPAKDFRPLNNVASFLSKLVSVHPFQAKRLTQVANEHSDYLREVIPPPFMTGSRYAI